MLKPPGRCYWCGEVATTREHVPSRGLFPEGYTNNLLTVPACASHNNHFSEYDEQVRVYLQAQETNKVAAEAWKDKTLRGLQRPEAQKLRAQLVENTFRSSAKRGDEQEGIMIVPGLILDSYFGKVTKALYFSISSIPCGHKEVRYFSRNYYDPADVQTLRFMEKAFVDIEYADGKAQNKEVFKWDHILTDKFFTVRMVFYEGVVVYSVMKLCDN